MDHTEDLAGNHLPMATEEGNQTQTDSTTDDDSYTFLWGKKQTIVKQSDGNTFVINIERDGDFDSQFEDSGYLNRNSDTNVYSTAESQGTMLTDNNTLTFTEMEPCNLLLPADRLSNDLNYCGLDLLADLCEHKTKSAVPDSLNGKDQNGNMAGMVDLHTAVEYTAGVSVSGGVLGVGGAHGVVDTEGSNTSVCKIVDSYSLAPLCNARPV